MPVPGLLWHYSDAAGMHGILKSGVLRFGHVGFLNDVTESSFGQSVVERFIAGNVPSLDRALQQPMCRQISTQMSQYGEFFICSLSEKPDSLSQWQRYGADGRGYTLGFEAGTLPAVLGAGVYLRRMLYHENEQQARLSDTLARHLVNLDKDFPFTKKQPKDWVIELRAAHLVGALHAASLEFKNHRFEDECEWRLLKACSFESNATPQPAISFNLRSDIVKPCIELPISSTGAGSLPIKSIICGPRLEAALARVAVERFAAVLGYADVSVRTSELYSVWR